jgi:glycylpeptide N-tetradecanoyltransferase
MIDKPIDVEKTVAEVKDQAFNLPAGFVWSDVDISDNAQAHEVYELLTQNYVEDDDNMFRFDYSVPFL